MGPIKHKALINVDLGEGYGNLKCGPDEELLPYISQANVACGFHSGDPLIMQSTVRLCKEHKVAIGAHPGLPDLQGFGRREMKLQPEELTAITVYQVGALKGFLDREGVPLNHVKPHGVLYGMMCRDYTVAEAVMKGIPKGVPVFGLAGTQMEKAAQDLGVDFWAEMYGDVKYSADAMLVIDRIKKPWKTDDVEKHVGQQLSTQSVTAVDGSTVQLPVKGYPISVLSKLGFGQLSTVWFAQDTQTNQYVSLKILTSEFWRVPHTKRERYILQDLKCHNTNHPGHNHVISLLDSFYHEGPNGKHMCLVYKAMGERVGRMRIRFPDRKVPQPLTKRIARQLLQALDYIHTCGYVHTDISPSNILTEIDNEEVLPYYLKSIEETQQPSTTPKSRYDPPIRSLGMMAPYDPHSNVRLADFGEAVRFDWDNRYHLIQPQDLRAPEVILSTGYDSKADIWNLGCVIWELFEDRIFIDGRILATDKFSYRGALHEMVHHLGPCPLELIERSPVGDKYFDSQGRVKDLPPSSFKRIWEFEENLQGYEQEVFFDFIKSMMRWLPEKRPSAKELLEHEWLKEEDK